MFEKLLLAATVTFSLSLFIGTAQTTPSPFSTAQDQVADLGNFSTIAVFPEAGLKALE